MRSTTKSYRENSENGALVLALDTASDQIALALGNSTSVISQLNTLARRQANSELLPTTQALFEREGLQASEVTAVVVGLGPGSFTGVRIGVATAKGVALGLGVPLYGVGTLDAIAWSAWLAGIRGLVAVVADAMRGEVYPARFDLSGEGVQRLDAHNVAKASEVAAFWSGRDGKDEVTSLPQLLGDGLFKFRDEFAEFSLLPEELWRPTGAGLLHAWFDTCARGVQGSGDAGALLPLYTRLSDAEENERKRLAAAGEIRQGVLLDASSVTPESGDAFIYRPMAAQDVEQVAALEAATFPEPHEAWSPQMVSDELAQRDRSCWVALLGTQIVGYASGQIVSGQLSILRVAVAKKAQRQGVATHLLSRLIEDARSLGASELFLEVRVSNVGAQALYRRFGLREVGRRPRYYSSRDGSRDAANREDALVMTGVLPTPAALKYPLLSSPSSPLPPLPLSPTSPSLSQLSSSSPPLQPRILAIETSCDETAAAVIAGDGLLLSDVIASQVDFHHRFGGVVPEIASRKHTEAIAAVVEQALQEANTPLSSLDAIAVTYAPGLIGALVVGVAYAKGLSWATGLPLVLVNHLEGHIYANKLANRGDEFLAPPFVVALLSGGTTLLVHVRNWGDYRVMGQTLDDAVGEAFDKVAKALGLGYPGGPAIAKLAEEGDPAAINFPRALLHSHGYDFSLSGLKTAVITWLRQQVAEGASFSPANVAASFQQAVIDVQVAKAVAACREAQVASFCIGGGVAANRALRSAYEQAMVRHGITAVYPPPIACTDNAAMIALVALERYKQGRFAPLNADAQANASLEQEY